MSSGTDLPATVDGELPSVPSDHTASRAPNDGEQMLVHSLENSDEWIQGEPINPTEIR